jgi:hypothetical protein
MQRHQADMPRSQRAELGQGINMTELLPRRWHRQETAKASEWIGAKPQFREQVIPEQPVGPWAFDCYGPRRIWLVDRRGEDCQAGLLPPEQGMGKIGLRLRMTWLNQDDASNPTR